MTTINLNQLAAEITRQLTLYTHEVQEAITETSEEVSKEGLKQIRKLSPKRDGGYRKGWRIKKEKGEYIIHNHIHYRLTHLLEKGHLKKNGRRNNATNGRTPTKKMIHIAPVENEMIRNFEEKLARRLRE